MIVAPGRAEHGVEAERYRDRQEGAFERMFEIGAVGGLRRQLLADVRQTAHHMDALQIRIGSDHAYRVQRRTIQAGRVGDDRAHRHVDEDVVKAACRIRFWSRSAHRRAVE